MLEKNLSIKPLEFWQWLCRKPSVGLFWAALSGMQYAAAASTVRQVNALFFNIRFRLQQCKNYWNRPRFDGVPVRSTYAYGRAHRYESLELSEVALLHVVDVDVVITHRSWHSAQRTIIHFHLMRWCDYRSICFLECCRLDVLLLSAAGWCCCCCFCYRPITDVTRHPPKRIISTANALKLSQSHNLTVEPVEKEQSLA